ncbi:MAG: ABC transporter permease [Magnetococcales bacterium]|nr:ABC transporter permease [Magnetococcales bacterium]NGZ05860.1 ABC transporter permease [Magnetococcales bacterium]
MTRPYFPTRLCMQVWRRHLLVWRKNAPASLVANLGEPFLYLLGMGFGLGRYVDTMGTLSYPVYLTAGILAANSMNAATFEAIYGGFTRMTRQQTFHAMLATPVGIADIVAGEVIWAATKAVFSGAAILLVGALMGAIPAATAPWALLVVFLSGLVFASMGMIVTAISPNYDFFMYYFTLVTTPMFLFCGVFYPLESLPELARLAAAWLPLTHVVALIRPLTTGLPFDNPWWHLGMLIGFAVLLFPMAVRRISKRIIV